MPILTLKYSIQQQNKLEQLMQALVTAINADHLKLMLCLILAFLSYVKIGEIQNQKTRIKKQETIEVRNHDMTRTNSKNIQNDSLRMGNGGEGADFGQGSQPMTFGEYIERSYLQKIQQQSKKSYKPQDFKLQREQKMDIQQNVQRQHKNQEHGVKISTGMNVQLAYQTPKCQKLYSTLKKTSERTAESKEDQLQNKKKVIKKPRKFFRRISYYSSPGKYKFVPRVSQIKKK